MTQSDFTRLAAMIFGLFSLIVAIAAVPEALNRAGSIGADSIRFAMIAISVAAGVVFLRARATIAMLRRIAGSTGTGPLRFCCALVMPVPVLINSLSGIVPYWAGLCIMGAFLIAFVFPGLAFRGVIVTASSALSMQDLGTLAKPMIHRNRWILYGYSAATGMLVLPFIFFIYAPQVILSEAYRPVGEWLAFGLPLGVIGITMLPLFWVVPAAARPRTLPGLTVCTAVTAFLAVAGYNIMLLRSVPAIAARIGGSEIVLSYPILTVEPDQTGRFCSRSVQIGTDAGPVKLCNFSPEMFEALTQSETLQITGKSTWMGQVASVIDVPG
ncbi:hypothetical protein [Roseovarius sp. Pro17]|uniref:hypothetical protein n=1 Tax=Roseovarius sp. Pro17 TaxID=3108175 RepID=UPI002D77E691|nr:hypothetical protein [Roseovarius sp. Pro17]